MTTHRTLNPIECLTEFNGPTVPTAPAVAPAVAPVIPQIPQEVLQERARAAAELQQAQADAQAAQAHAEQLQQQLTQMQRSNLTSDQQMAAMLDDMRTAQASLAEELRQQQAQALEAQRQHDLNLYRANLIKDAQAQGIGLSEHLVVGNSPQEIQLSLAAAQADYTRQRDHFFAQFQASQPAQPQVPAAPVATQPAPVQLTQEQQLQAAHAAQQAQIQAAAGVQGPTPTAPAPAPTPGNVITPEMVSTLTSQEAIRSGQWAQHRDSVLASLKQTSPAHQPLPMRPFPTHQPQVALPTVSPQLPQQQQGMPHQALPGGMSQPTGMPVPQAMTPQQQAYVLQQQALMAQQAQAQVPPQQQNGPLNFKVDQKLAGFPAAQHPNAAALAAASVNRQPGVHPQLLNRG